MDSDLRMLFHKWLLDTPYMCRPEIAHTIGGLKEDFDAWLAANHARSDLRGAGGARAFCALVRPLIHLGALARVAPECNRVAFDPDSLKRYLGAVTLVDF